MLFSAGQVSGFENRRVAIARLWKAIQKRPIALRHDMTAPAEQDECKRPSKTRVAINLLQTPAGMTLAALMTATGWQAHSVRGHCRAEQMRR